MQAYGRAFARVYNMKWGGFANRVAPRILDFYESSPVSQVNKSVLDLCECAPGMKRNCG